MLRLDNWSDDDRYFVLVLRKSDVSNVGCFNKGFVILIKNITVKNQKFPLEMSVVTQNAHLVIANDMEWDDM